MVDTINVRFHKKPTYEKTERYFNYSAEVVDGEVKLKKTSVVVPSLAADFSPQVNAITRPGSSSPRQRVNIDAVDVPAYVDSITEQNSK